MADKTIGELSRVQTMTDTDLFVLEQNDTAKSLTWELFLNSTLNAIGANGGITNITYTAPAAGSVVGNIKISVTNTDTEYSFDINNGVGISSISKTASSGLRDTYTISYNNGTTSTFDVMNGAKGDAGDNSYVHIKYASVRPTSNADINANDDPDKWMGICTDHNESAPVSYTSYKWYNIKGTAGDVGAAAYITNYRSEYCYSEDGVTPPASGWSTDVPAVQQGKYLWTKAVNTWNNGNDTFSYSISKVGSDGTGSGTVRSVGITAGSGISVSGSPVTDSGNITVGHSNSVIAKTTAGLYPFTYDDQGHITGSGAAATAASIGAIPNPSDKESGQFLKYNGSSWIADSVVTNGIPNPSEKESGQFLKYNGSSWIADSVASSARRNLLVNPWFTVDQYKYTLSGTTTRFTLENYFVDCWKRMIGTVTVLDNGNIQITNGTIVQYFEFPMDTSLQYTASVNKVSGNGTVTATFLPNSSPYATFSISVVGTAVINKAKLEAGQGSTLDMDAAPDYSTELDKCRRYMQMYPASTSTAPTATGIAFSATSIRVLAPLPTMLRVDPSINYVVGTVAKFQCKAGTKSIAPTAASVVRTSNANIVLILTCSGATEGTIFSVSYASTNLIVALNANL